MYVKIYSGDNLEVSNKLIDENVKVDLIYLDPPYNTKKSNKSYLDTFQISKNESSYENLLSDSLEWIKMMQPRLENAHKLLNPTGFIAISIGHQEIGTLKILMDKIFGRKNIIAIMPRITNMVGKTTKTISQNHDFIVLYKKSAQTILAKKKIKIDSYKLIDEFFKKRGKYQLRSLDYKDFKYQKTLDFPVTFEGKKYYPGKSYDFYKKRQKGSSSYRDWCWLWSSERIQKAIKHKFIIAKDDKLWKKTYVKAKLNRQHEIEYGHGQQPYSSLDFINREFSNSIGTKELHMQIASNGFSYPKPKSLVKKLIEMSPARIPIVLDMFAGTGSSGVAAIEAGANALLIQNDEKNKIGKKEKIISIAYKNIKIANQKKENTHIVTLIE